MRTLLKVVGIVVLVAGVIVGGALVWLSLRQPDQRAAFSETIERTPERVARGEYLVRHVGICFDCHSERSAAAYAMPFKPGREGVAGFSWDREKGFPGVLVASNLTSDRETGLGSWTDGEIVRAIREGVDRNGEALFPIMPYAHLRELSDEDVKAVVAYLRTLQPVRWQRPAKELDVPLNFVEKFVPKPLEGPVAGPDRSDPVAYGKYLTTVASCVECHTPKDEKERPIAGQEFSGGWTMHGPGFEVVTANITPHPANWMGIATKEQFIARFRSYANFQEVPAANGRNTLMPWISYSGMTDEDLGAIYDYLKTVKPIERKVNPFAPAATHAAR